MLREIIRPDNEYYNLHIPKEYVGKDVEVIVLPLFDLVKTTQVEQLKTFDPMAFFGAASASKASVDAYLSQIRSEWD
ncbi:hypothetical protein [Thiomicrospira cyclica]|uniref:Uncharacterized protein n=1 Tax=Thiomicrospira cyclica (strain DSM 14477 / JCM 11371 / ALM1) TaxID=717773 RepID=F6DCU7_THICA|nr:hypothetical protein [Thiomicrospira cyclica]AEG31683.1 hypothetical protein Thicy_0912 [Thiomicrospira cyclica ALM1]